jgi:hypothetical protein
MNIVDRLGEREMTFTAFLHIKKVIEGDFTDLLLTITATS